MVLDSRIDLVKAAYSISSLDDWQKITPADVVAIDNVAEVTLNHIRLYLAGQGRTLAGDETPGYWMQHLGRAKVVQQIAKEDRFEVAPFTILQDTAEQEPFEFTNLRADAKHNHRPLVVPVELHSLGRHPHGRGDYSIKIDGVYFDRVIAVERKSVADFQGTLLDFDKGGRDRFEQELLNLGRLSHYLVVVEGTLYNSVQVSERGRKRDAQTHAKTMLRSVLAMLQDYQVPILFCDDRRLAEVSTFRFLERFYRKRAEKKKKAESLLASI